MEYFTIKRPLFLVPSSICEKEFEKIDKFMKLIEKSEVGKIISNVKYKDKNCIGKKGYNPYNLFATIVYCFSKFNATLRDKDIQNTKIVSCISLLIATLASMLIHAKRN